MALRLTLAQINTTLGDLEANRAAVLAQARRARDSGASIVVFPALTLLGWPAQDLVLNPSVQHACTTSLEMLAAELVDAGLADLTVVLGVLGPPVPDDEQSTSGTPRPPSLRHRPTHRAVALRHGTIVAAHDKQRLAVDATLDEARTFASGSPRPHGASPREAPPEVLEVDGHRFALAVATGRSPALDLPRSGDGIDAVLVLGALAFEQGPAPSWAEVISTAAGQLDIPVLVTNLVGGQDELVFAGASLVVGADGTVAGRARDLEPDLLTVELSADGTLRGPPPAVPLGEIAATYRAITVALRDYATTSGLHRIVLGLSGGIDSALVAVIAADALGGENVLGLAMPSVHSSQHALDDATDLAERVGAELRIVSIAPMVDAFQAHLRLTGVSAENLQARVRGVIVMGVSNEEGRLALATGNKSEIAVGYSTIYGDAVGGYAPLKDVPKTLVWRLARWRNDQAIEAGQIPPIPESSITKPPSAELRPGQRDQDSLPDYRALDAVVDAHLSHAEGRVELLARGLATDAVDRVLELLSRAEWKRRQYPIGPRLTDRMLGSDQRLPATSRWVDPAPASTDSPHTPATTEHR